MKNKKSYTWLDSKFDTDYMLLKYYGLKRKKIRSY